MKKILFLLFMSIIAQGSAQTRNFQLLQVPQNTAKGQLQPEDILSYASKSKVDCARDIEFRQFVRTYTNESSTENYMLVTVENGLIYLLPIIHGVCSPVRVISTYDENSPIAWQCPVMLLINKKSPN